MDRDDLLRRIDLAALLDELSPGPATRLGPNARWRCIDPGHDDQHPSISMFTDRRRIQRWKCWSGGHGGTAIDALLVAKGGTVADVLADLRRRAGDPEIVDPERAAPPHPKPPIDQPQIADAAVLEYVERCSKLLWRPEGRVVRDYLVQARHLDPDTLKANQVGADLGPSFLPRAAGLPRGGVAAVLPTHGSDGRVTYAQARYLDPIDGRPKYDNPASRLATNPRVGWVAAPHERDGRHLIVCEGTIDALSVASQGIAAVAVLGATYVDRRVAAELLSHSNGRRVVLAFDGDRAGRTATDTLTAELNARRATPTVVALPDGRDVNGQLGSDAQWLQRQLGVMAPERGSLPDLGLARSLR